MRYKGRLGSRKFRTNLLTHSASERAMNFGGRPLDEAKSQRMVALRSMPMQRSNNKQTSNKVAATDRINWFVVA